MKVIILAAGYGTRLQRDIDQDTSGKWSHLSGVSKPLLPVGDRPLISHWLDLLHRANFTNSDVHVVVNQLYLDSFKKWAVNYPGINMVSDGTTLNSNRLGAVGCIRLTVKHFSITEDVMVIGGDTLFKSDFDVQSVVDKFRERGVSQTVYVDCSDQDVTKTGIIELDGRGVITNFLEKPRPEDTVSRKSCPCFYLFAADCLPLLDDFLSLDLPLARLDAPGNFLAYLYTRRPVTATRVSGRYDVGSLQSYVHCLTDYTTSVGSSHTE